MQTMEYSYIWMENDTTFGLMNVDSEICRQKMICEMEKAAAKNSPQVPAEANSLLQNVESRIAEINV